MKYNKEWKRLMETDEYGPLYKAALSYDVWKQRLKHPTVHFQLNWPLYLEQDCKRTDAFIFHTKPRCTFPFPFPCSFSFCNDATLTPKEQLRMSDLNKRTLYKVCKRIDKHLILPTATTPLPNNSNSNRHAKGAAMAWYNDAVQTRRYRFLGCPELFRIRILASGAPLPTECPICLEDIQPASCVATACGHAFCASCDKRLRQRKIHTCPMCRSAL